MKDEVAKTGASSVNLRSLWRPEYASYMVEGTPGGPYGGSTNYFNTVEHNMRTKRRSACQHPPSPGLVALALHTLTTYLIQQTHLPSLSSGQMKSPFLATPGLPGSPRTSGRGGGRRLPSTSQYSGMRTHPIHSEKTFPSLEMMEAAKQLLRITTCILTQWDSVWDFAASSSHFRPTACP